MPHRKKLISLLEQYQCVDIDEVDYKKQMISFANANKDCFERSNTCGHFTASSWLMSNDEQSALLMHHTKLDRWFQLGGHADGDRDLLSVSIREAQEESGIQSIVALSSEIFDIDVHEIPQNQKEAGHTHYDLRFLLKVSGDQRVNKNSESKELRWISKDPLQLPTNSRSVVRMFEKWVAARSTL